LDFVDCHHVYRRQPSAQISAADQYKIDHPVQVIDKGLRAGEPGSDCEHALPLANGHFTYLPTINSNFPNLLNQQPAPPLFMNCLGSAPNQTWFSFSVSDTGDIHILLESNSLADYDFIFLDGTGFPCAEFNNFTSLYSYPETINCSFAGGNDPELITGNVYPGRIYYLVVTNFSNELIPFELTIDNSVSLMPVNFSRVQGKVYADVNNNCVFDSGDNPIAQASLQLQGTILYTRTDSSGDYSWLLPSNLTGTIVANTSAFSSLLWQNNCSDQPAAFEINYGGTSTMTANVAYYSSVDCAIPVVETAVPFLRRCFTSTRTVRYCNQGTTPTENAIIILQYDDGIIPVNFSVPYTQNGNLYSIEAGSLPIGGCGNFTVRDSVTCENGIGSYATVTAHISPVPDCLIFPAQWDHSDLEVSAICEDGESAVFTITNAGSGNMNTGTPYQISRNNQNESSGFVQLNSGASQTITVANQNDLVTLEVYQTIGNPFNNSAWALSDCGSELLFLGASPAIAISDHQPWLDIDIEEIIGAYDPNDKAAWPFGSGASNKINRADDLEYRIRFQNTGSDTAFTVVIVDTLSEYLNPAVVRVTGNSHPYTYSLLGNVITFTFADIQLPDSTTNLEGSIGYIRFTILQAEGNPVNYQISNAADIYFDFNPPVRTNAVIRTVGETALEISEQVDERAMAYPVPASEALSFILPEIWETAHYSLSIVDITGRIIHVQQGSGKNMSSSVSSFAEGIYFAVFASLNGDFIRVSFVVSR